MSIRIKGFYATEQQWQDKNPVLLKGERGTALIIINDITFQRSKTGDGTTAWNDLPYDNEEPYPYIENTNTSVGGLPAGSNLYGKKWYEAVQSLTTTYLAPYISNFRLADAVSKIVEIGTPYAGASQLAASWQFVNGINIADDNTGKIWASEAGVFNNVGDQSNKTSLNIKTDSPFNLVFANNYTKSHPGTLTVYLSGFNTLGNPMSTVGASITFAGKMIFGSSQLAKLTTQNEIDTHLTSSILTTNPNTDYSLLGGGYTYLLVPTFVNLTNAVFQDIDLVTGAVISEYAMQPQNNWDNTAPLTVPYNNGNITVNYQVYRSQYSYGSATKLRLQYSTIIAV